MCRMPRRLRVSTGGIVFHVINRRVGRQRIFEDEADYAAFEKAIGQACERLPMRVVGYCLMPNHWHLVLWPSHDGDLSRFMQWLTVTHTHRWHAHRGVVGEGALYQGRFKSFPVEKDEHFLTVMRYVERNPLRGKLVTRAQDWQWSSMWGRSKKFEWLTSSGQWPMPAPQNWVRFVNEPQSDLELSELRRSVNRGTPFGDAHWARSTADKLHLQSTLRDPWRPARPR